MAGNKTKTKKTLVDEFVSFLDEYRVIGLAVAVVIGGAVNKLTKSLAEDIIMPVIEVLIPGGTWRTLTLELGPVKLTVGNFLGALTDFFIIALIIFLLYKFVLRKEKINKIK